MAISPISQGQAAPSIASQAISPTDAEAKNIQNQITSKHQSLNRLSADYEMTSEEKAKERQELQKQIAELNRKLRMLRMEKKEEAKEAQKEQEQKDILAQKQEKENSPEDSDQNISVEEQEKQQKKVNIPPQNIQKLLEAGTLLQRERIQQSTERQKESTISTLETEIKSDKLYGSDTTPKEEKLSSLIKELPFELKIKDQQKLQNNSEKNANAKIVISEDII